MKRVFLSFLVFFVLGTSSRPVDRHEASTLSPNGPVATVDFLRKYGYLETGGSSSSETIYTEESIRQGVLLMQRFGGLPETGMLDNDTMQLLTKSRCGVPDVIRSKDHERKKRYTIASKGWNKRSLTFSLQNWSPKLGKEATLEDMRKAFGAWTDYAQLKFKERPMNSKADILISFGRGYHGDGYPFDGRGSVLAHAYYPQDDGLGGDVHFDEDEDWWAPSGLFKDHLASPISFASVATHELGHSLGLGHSYDKESIMFPYYQGELGSNPTLGYDDIRALHQLYIQRYIPEGTNSISEEEDEEGEGKDEDESKTSSSRPVTTTEKSPVRTTTRTTIIPGGRTTERPRMTTGMTTMSTTRRTEITSSSTPSSTPTTTSRTSPSSPNTPSVPKRGGGGEEEEQVDSGEKSNPREEESKTDYEEESLRNICSNVPFKISFLRNEIFVFRGQYMWRLAVRGTLPPPAYPVTISNLFSPLSHLKSVDAAYERDLDGHLIFFSGSEYWELDGTRAIPGSPKPLTALGLPSTLTKLDGAFIWEKNGLTYFFSGNQYWRYNETIKKIDDGYPLGMERWGNVPTPIDSVLRWRDGRTYFFKDEDFWRFDDVLVNVEEHFPLKTRPYWFGC